MGHDSNEAYHLFKQSHKELHQDLWQLIERRETRLCWLWLGDHDDQGFAEYAFDHNGTVYTINVHRYLYYALYDKLLDVVGHKCNNNWCCNMNHLVVTPQAAILC